MKLSIAILLWRRSRECIWKRAHTIFSWTYITISFFFIFRRENIFHIINRNKKKQFITLMQFFTYSGSVNADVIINFSSDNAVLISLSSIKKEVWLRKLIYIFSVI